ncbi:molybdopterin synthase catalytic subunit MoaE [Cellvibrio sp. KY-GH-1]|uniref:molybdopterin synthase catalytic subunit MoaE n=1 Tax=Cellvibrio sp. KY-GH-1 TaxID=2303332 RepID=UPI0012449107|nr:molybdopterin synthase catalytic subunit MoaE [Cellvibrio sp. KY-GH-1]QEY15414.1 molybdopterin synthase catalytic subunit MoaE [Cellvibrio sp. KY-GH-1]
MTFSICVQQNDFDVGQEYSALIAGNAAAGAVVFFVGRVRDFNDGRLVAGLSLEHYPGMTEKILEQILAEAKLRWDLVSARIIHRVGELRLGDQIVFVGVTSAHREHAFQAAEFLMDFLKTRAPFWKKEITQEGKNVWVEAKNKDGEAAERWDSDRNSASS